jgi:ankyrin repeat protein
LIENSADIHCLDDQPLRSACFRGYFDIVKLLVEYGAVISACEYEAIKNVINNKKKCHFKIFIRKL